MFCMIVVSGTHLILDETLLTAGQLNNNGCLNLQALTNVLTWQKVKYDFQYHIVEISCDLVSLVSQLCVYVIVVTQACATLFCIHIRQIMHAYVTTDAKQKHLGCKEVRGQSEAACKQPGVTKALIPAEAKTLLYQKYF